VVRDRGGNAVLVMGQRRRRQMREQDLERALSPSLLDR